MRLYPGTSANGQYLEQLAGTCWFVWNHILAGHETDYRMWMASGKLEDGTGSPTFFTLAQRFTQLQNTPDNKWLQDHSHEIVRYACKYMRDGYAAFLDSDRLDHGRSPCKAKHYTQPDFTIPPAVRIQDGCLRNPKLGWSVWPASPGTPTASH